MSGRPRRIGPALAAVAALAALAEACLEPGASRCPSGNVCPPGFLCRDVAGADVSVCLLTAGGFCAFHDPTTDAPCGAGMACSDALRSCVSLAQLEACATVPDGEHCSLPGFPEGRLVCRVGTCVLPACGDGIAERFEPCDDGNLDAGDGCAPTCEVEPGWTCTGSPSVCLRSCGDGTLLAGEHCDDGNIDPGDGCSPLCQVEAGWYCAGSPSACTTRCGDGVRAGDELCDGDDVQGVTCPSLGLDFGVVRCGPGCTLDDSACAPGVSIPAGTFTMGSPEDEPGRTSYELLHEVELTRSFVLQVTEVTQHQFLTAMGYDPSEPGCGPDCPVDTVSWHEAAAYLNVLSAAEGEKLCYACDGQAPAVFCELSAMFPSPYHCPGYRLPTEAEWEYAARAGTTTATYAGTGTLVGCEQPNAVLDPIAWFCGNSAGAKHPVGSLAPNAWGLVDVIGNLAEWVGDVVQDLPANDDLDPWGDGRDGPFRIGRGGAYEHEAAQSRAAIRFWQEPSVRLWLVGFRAARTIPGGQQGLATSR